MQRFSPSAAGLAPLALLAILFVWMIARADEFDPLQVDIHADGTATLHLEADSGSLQRLEFSSDLKSWHGIVALEMPALGSIDLEHSSAGAAAQRYYRSVTLPAGSLTGDILNTATGDVIIHPVDHASFVIEWNGKFIYNDPVGGGSAFTGIPKADLVLIGHRHSDHWSSSTINSIIKAESVFVAPQDVYDLMAAPFKERTTVLANGTNTDVLGLHVAAIPAYNSNHPQGRDNGYVITIGGKRLYMSGDTADVAEMRALENIDVAFVAMNIPFTMSVDQAASAIREFKPAVIYPYHYRNQNGSFADFARLANLLGDDFEIELRLRNWY